MLKIKKLFIYIVIIIIVLPTSGCSSRNKINRSNINQNLESQEVIENRSTVNEPITIGWSVYDSTPQYFQTMQTGVLSKARDLGIKVISHNQQSETSEMITGVLSLIEQGVDALLISPVNPEAMGIINKAAEDAGVPVVVIDIGTGGADVEAFIISDNVGGGVFAAQYALKLARDNNLESKNVAIIKVEESATYARRRGEAFKDVMAVSGYDIVAEVTANSSREQAYAVMQPILNQYGDDLAIVFAENDRMALGAAQAIAEAGKTGEIMVLGFDGIPSAMEAIKAGIMQGTIAQQPFEMGALGVELAQALLTGETILYDDPIRKELYIEVFLVDETGTLQNTLIY
jgi:ribose transport system substrate-binding protein